MAFGTFNYSLLSSVRELCTRRGRGKKIGRPRIRVVQGELKRKGLLKLFPLSRETHLLSETPPSVRERGSLREMVLRLFVCEYGEEVV